MAGYLFLCVGVLFSNCAVFFYIYIYIYIYYYYFLSGFHKCVSDIFSFVHMWKLVRAFSLPYYW